MTANTRQRFRGGLGQDPSQIAASYGIDLSMAPSVVPDFSTLGIPVSDPSVAAASAAASAANLATVQQQLSSLALSTTPPTLPTTSPTAPSPWQSLLAALSVGGAKTAEQIALQQSSYSNPLYQKAYYQQTPGGGVIASNVPTTGLAQTFGSGSTMMPLLLIGGLVVMMMMSKH